MTPFFQANSSIACCLLGGFQTRAAQACSSSGQLTGIVRSHVNFDVDTRSQVKEIEALLPVQP